MRKKRSRFKAYIIIGILVFIFLIIFLVIKVSKVAVNEIAVIPIKGLITTDNSAFLWEEKGTSSTIIVKNIKNANKDSRIKGIILEIDSPGGTVVASKEIADTIKKVNKTTVALIKEIGTSGAYWVASSADFIVADPMSITGSIGVISSYLEFSGLIEKYGITYEELATGEYKDVGSPYKKLTEKERILLQNKLNQIHSFFVKEIAKNRNLPEEKIDALANGMFYLGQEAYKIGLVDYLGDLDLAKELIKKVANITEATLVKYEEEESLLDLLSKISSGISFYIGKGIGSEIYRELKTQKRFEIIS